MIIPQTRKPIQVMLHKGLALFSPSVKTEADSKVVNYTSWQLQDVKGNTIDFKDLKGKVVLINFWATWCPPCIAEMPNLQKLYDDYNHKVVFLFVSNEKKEKVEAFLSENKYSFNVFTPLEHPSEFEVSSIPRTLLINKEGNILIDKEGAANWNSETVRETLDNLLK
ncbi:TlpA disulfide reductase family protein [Oceanihabitans sp. 1_MG-2023]|uniref:TlpA family protein disulfide reductase n=1 Tax=Flavobacteriaceae TaxID=49546 RepID=UPI0020918C55|nr:MULTISPECIES: TlpA disulfide reductase family protein [Flavobacteriaceae]MDO6621712.1 TlpA disulfide reductase family protein [Oceanihabitans sp. 1_MG-2023]